MPAEYSFGDAVRSQDQRASFAILDQLEPRFGKLRWLSFTMPATTDRQTIKNFYRERLTPLGWKDLPLRQPDRDGWAFALESGGGHFVLAGVALSPDQAGNGLVPFSVLTNLADDNDPNTL